jgi:threonine synthase
MTTELLTSTRTTTAGTPAGPDVTPPAAAGAETPGARIVGLRCRNCSRAEALGPSYVCAACFGPLEVAYDYDVVARTFTPDAVGARRAGIWRYLELLPVDAAPARGLAVGSTPLVAASRLGPAIGIDRLWLKDDTRNPTLSFKDRAVAVAAARAAQWQLPALACASTGNLAGATAAAAAALGIPAYVVIPSDLEPAKVDHALAYGASVIRVDGTYDDVNRLCLEIADETGWGFVNVNLRPFYAEGSKTLAFEVAEDLGWRLPDVIVAPIASGALYTKLAKGIDELVRLGFVEPKPVRFIGGQAAGCGPVATAFASGDEDVKPVRIPDTIVRSLAIGSPADGRYALEQARATGSTIEAVSDEATAAAIRQVASTEGIFPETAGGVTIAAAAQARASGAIGPDDEVVVLLTGNGLKTPDAPAYGIESRRAERGGPGLADPIAPNLFAFLDWLGD